MILRSFIFFLLIVCLRAQAQISNTDKIQAKVNEVIKNLDWGGLDKYSQLNEIQLSKSNPDVVFMGDSITEGWSFYFPDFFSKNNFSNRGIGGQTTAQMLLRFRQDVIQLKPNIVVILAGINDIAQNSRFYNLEIVAGNIFSMVDLAKSKGIKPIICSVLPAAEFPWNPSILPSDFVIELNELLISYAEKNEITYLDYYGEMKDKKGGLRTELTTDGVHVTKEGYELMNLSVKKAIRDLSN